MDLRWKDIVQLEFFYSLKRWYRYQPHRFSVSQGLKQRFRPPAAFHCPLCFQAASLLSAVPSALEECVHSVPDPPHLRTVLTYHTTLGHFDFSGEPLLSLCVNVV